MKLWVGDSFWSQNVKVTAFFEASPEISALAPEYYTIPILFPFHKCYTIGKYSTIY